jgi:NAD-dependent dihydropyrimidine dehydrogenase PreA subunit
MGSKATIIVFEDRDGQATRERLQEDLVAALTTWPGVELVVLPHLYDLAPDGPGMQHLRSVPGNLIALCRLHPRAAYWILDAHGIKGRVDRSSFPADEPPDTAPTSPGGGADVTADRTIWCLDLRTHDQPDPFLAEIARMVGESTGEPATLTGRSRGVGGSENRVEEVTHHRWYPVVDYSRCQNCLECLNFCLFGVFGLDESQRLLVEQPDACRDGCPACSRVCPSRAIMFPQHTSPAIAGDPEAPVDALDANLVQLFGAKNPEEGAAAERDRALSEKAEDEKGAAEKDEDELDRLVDDLDRMDL